MAHLDRYQVVVLKHGVWKIERGGRHIVPFETPLAIPEAHAIAEQADVRRCPTAEALLQAGLGRAR